jgi:outer membrane protein TolC
MRDELRQAVRLEVTNAHSEVVSTLEAIRAARQGVEQAQSMATLADARHQQGLSSRLDVLNARTELAAAENGLHQARYDYELAAVRLSFARGSAVP